jgi:thioredoxin 1
LLTFGKRSTPGKVPAIVKVVARSPRALLPKHHASQGVFLMAGKNVIELTDDNFDAEVVSSPIPVLVDFTATWCGPCKMLAPIVEKIADENVGKYKVAKLDIDDAPKVTQRFGVRSVPTVLVFKGGSKAGQHVGVTNKETLIKMLEG